MEKHDCTREQAQSDIDDLIKRGVLLPTNNLGRTIYFKLSDVHLNTPRNPVTQEITDDYSSPNP